MVIGETELTNIPYSKIQYKRGKGRYAIIFPGQITTQCAVTLSGPGYLKKKIHTALI